MLKTTHAALFFLAAGILTSVSILSAFQIFFTIAVAYYTFVAIKNKNTQLPTSAYWLMGFVVVATLSLFVNLELIPRPGKNFGRLKYYLFGIGGIFVLQVWLKEASDKTKKILSNLFLVTVMIAGVVACYQYFILGKPRPKGLTDTMRYAYGSAMILLTILSALIHREKLKSWFDPRVGLAAFVIGFAGMYITHTRGALLGFMVGLPVVLYFYRPKIALGIGALAVLAGGLLGYFYLFGNIQEGSGTRFLMTKSNSGDVIRRSQWQAAVIAIKERPVIGYGLSNFHSQLKRIKTDYDLDAKEYNDAHSHNLFLEIASGTGLVGLFFFLAWLTTWASEMIRARSVVTALVLPFGAAWLSSSMFEVTLDANNASMIFFVYAVSVAAQRTFSKEITPPSP